MVSRENQAILTSLATVAVGLVVFGAIELTVGVPGGWTNFVAFLFFVVLGFVVPQLYLSRTDTSVPSVTRLRVVVVLSIVLAGIFSANATEREALAIVITTGVIVGLVVGIEIREGYLASTAAGSDPE